MNLKRYYWDMNEKARNETLKTILKNPQHPKFFIRIYTLLSRCDKIKEVLHFIGKEEFAEAWPDIRKYWKKNAVLNDYFYWWDSVYRQLINNYPKGQPIELLSEIGIMLQQARLKQGINQKDLSERTQIKQPDISKIENGKANITLTTLYKLLKVLQINRLNIKIS